MELQRVIRVTVNLEGFARDCFDQYVSGMKGQIVEASGSDPFDLLVTERMEDIWLALEQGTPAIFVSAKVQANGADGLLESVVCQDEKTGEFFPGFLQKAEWLTGKAEVHGPPENRRWVSAVVVLPNPLTLKIRDAGMQSATE